MSKGTIFLLVVAGAITADMAMEIAVKPLIAKILPALMVGFQTAQTYAAGPPPDGL